MRSSSAPFAFEQLSGRPAVAGPGAAAREAAALLDAARADADAIRAGAHEEGLRAGHAAGMAAVEDRLGPAAEALAAAHVELAAERARVADQVEAHAAELALTLAEKILGAALAARPEHVVDVVRGGLRRLVERDRVVVLVNADDLELVRAATGGLVASLGGIGEIDVQAERRVSRGGAIVRTAVGEVDGRLETQLERAREALLAGLAGDGDAGAEAAA